jgi:hypothetical protein
MTAKWRFLHDDKASALQMADDAQGSDSRHELTGMMNALSAFELQSEGNRVA